MDEFLFNKRYNIDIGTVVKNSEMEQNIKNLITIKTHNLDFFRLSQIMIIRF